MEYKLPANYAGLGEFAEYGFMPSLNKNLIQKRIKNRKTVSLNPKASLLVGSSSAILSKRFLPIRSEFNKDTAEPSDSEIAAARQKIEADQVAKAAELQAQGQVGGAQALLAGDALDSASQAIQMERDQLEADRAKRDAAIAAENKRNKMIGYGLAGVLSLGVLFLVLR